MEKQPDDLDTRCNEKVAASTLYTVAASATLHTGHAGDRRHSAGVLTVSPLAEDHVSLHSILDRYWLARHAQTCHQALTLIREEKTSVIVCERDLPDAGWKEILNGVMPLRSAPRLIVFSGLADERLWAEVLNLGGFDVLLKPFQAGEVLWAVGMAWHDWAVRSQSGA